MKRTSVPERALLAASILSAAVIGACGADSESDAAADAADTIYVSFETEQDIEAFFEEVNYSPQAWVEGVREIPRMYVTEVAARWRERANSDLTVQSKKRIFFRAMGPLALRSNELIQAEREQLLALPDELEPDDRDWLADLATDYGLEPPDAGEGSDAGTASADVWDALRAELEVRVDEVPVSLVLAQAANESGWGTSRFAHEGNALFGQWSFGGSGMLPEAQRASLGDYRVAAFETPLLSVIAYMRNLNTHAAYAPLRELRAQARAAGRPLSGYELAGGLERYSERGQEYVEEIRSMIDTNRLRETDETYLAPGPVYLVVPPDKMPSA